MSLIGTALQRSRGAALVEFAIVSMLLLTLLFGIIEFGLMMKDYLTVNQAAREGARAAALGSDPSAVEVRARSSAAGLSEDEQNLITVSSYYREYVEGSGWGNWTPGVPPAGSNNREMQVKVEVSYPHSTIVGSLFGFGSTVTVKGKMVMRRENSPNPP